MGSFWFPAHPPPEGKGSPVCPRSSGSGPLRDGSFACSYNPRAPCAARKELILATALTWLPPLRLRVPSAGRAKEQGRPTRLRARSGSAVFTYTATLRPNSATPPPKHFQDHLITSM